MGRTTEFSVSRPRYFHSDAADRDQRPSQSRDNVRNKHASPRDRSYDVRADRVLLDENLHYLSPSKCRGPHHQVLPRNARDVEARNSMAERHVQCDWRPADVVQSLGVLRGIATALRKEGDSKRDQIGLADLMWKRVSCDILQMSCTLAAKARICVSPCFCQRMGSRRSLAREVLSGSTAISSRVREQP